MNALQLEAAQRHVSHSGLFLAKFVLCMHMNGYLPASNQNSVIAIRLINPDFQKGAIIW